MKELIYLDYNATTPVLESIARQIAVYLTEQFGNPSSGHPLGRAARQAVELARDKVAELLSCDRSEIVFTSGGTEANNQAIRGIAAARDDRKKIITSVIEHPATIRPCEALEAWGWTVDRLPVDGDGVVDVDRLIDRLDESTALVTVMHANNETGTIQPIARIAEAAHRVGAMVHCDAAQSVGKIPTRVDELGVDLLSVAGHKFYAPKGIGALYVRRGTELAPLMAGAGHEGGRRPGTENVPGIVGFGEACALAIESMGTEMGRVGALRDDLWRRLKTEIPQAKLNGHPVDRLPNTLNLSFPDISGSAVLARADGLAASTGAACHEGGTEIPSAVLVAMGIPAAVALGSVRLSLGRSSTSAQIEAAAEMLINAYRRAIADISIHD